MSVDWGQTPSLVTLHRLSETSPHALACLEVPTCLRQICWPSTGGGKTLASAGRSKLELAGTGFVECADFLAAWQCARGGIRPYSLRRLECRL